EQSCNIIALTVFLRNHLKMFSRITSAMSLKDFGKTMATSFRQALGMTHPLEPLRELVSTTYSPYASKVFQGGRDAVPVHLFSSDSLYGQFLLKKSGNWQIMHSVDHDGDSEGVYLNIEQMNLDDKAQHYKIALSLEHDVTHDDQSKVDPLY